MSMAEKYPLALPEGTILAGQYTIEQVLGQGGFGITYRAKDYKTNQDVAIKEFFPDTLAYRENTTVISYPGERSESYLYGRECFLQEAKTLAEFIDNETIVRIHSYFEENGTAYFVMDYIDGVSFDKYLEGKGGKISIAEAKSILLPIMDALGAVHAKGIVHRDVTPDNISIAKDGTAYLLDFGAARYSLGDKSRSLDVILKHGFAPKEQYTRRGKQGSFTDVYSLAATFYFAITGKRPPDSVDRLDEDDLIPPRNLGIRMTTDEENALLQALSVQPAERFQTMAAFKHAMQQTDATSPQPAPAPVIPESVIPPTVAANDAPPVQPQPAQAASPQQGKLAALFQGKKQSAVIAAAVCICIVIAGISFASAAAARKGSESGRHTADASDADSSSFAAEDSDAGSETSAAVTASITETTAEETTTETTTVTTEAGIPAEDLYLRGNSAQNLRNSGLYTSSGGYQFWADNNNSVVYCKKGSGDSVMQVQFLAERFASYTCLSYIDEHLYYLKNGRACRKSIETFLKSAEGEAIPELDVYSDAGIETMYICNQYYFIVTKAEKLYRISRETGQMEESVDLSADPYDGADQITFGGGWVYYITESEEGYSEIHRMRADDFSDVDSSYIYTREYFDCPVVESGKLYVLANIGKREIREYNADLTNPETDSKAWSLTDMLKDETGGNIYMYNLIKIRQNVFFRGSNNMLYHIVLNSDGTYDTALSGAMAAGDSRARCMSGAYHDGSNTSDTSGWIYYPAGYELNENGYYDDHLMSYRYFDQNGVLYEEALVNTESARAEHE